MEELVLDIETDWYRQITVLGFRSSSTGLVQLVGDEVTRRRLLRELPRRAILFTYNGHCFDLPIIRSQLGVDLRETFDSHDLRFVCQRAGLKGGLKAVEHRIGVRRKLRGLDGWDAIALWSAFEEGNRTALKKLLGYNAEDLAGLRAIRRYLKARGHLEI